MDVSPDIGREGGGPVTEWTDGVVVTTAPKLVKGAQPISLHWYRRRRMVALNPGSPVLEAARAIEHNRIGAVVVLERGRAVGIVTDRNLAVRVLGQALDPEATKIMTS